MPDIAFFDKITDLLLVRNFIYLERRLLDTHENWKVEAILGRIGCNTQVDFTYYVPRRSTPCMTLAVIDLINRVRECDRDFSEWCHLFEYHDDSIESKKEWEELQALRHKLIQIDLLPRYLGLVSSWHVQILKCCQQN